MYLHGSFESCSQISIENRSRSSRSSSIRSSEKRRPGSIKLNVPNEPKKKSSSPFGKVASRVSEEVSQADLSEPNDEGLFKKRSKSERSETQNDRNGEEAAQHDRSPEVDDEKYPKQDRRPTVDELEWDSPDDKGNPHNWSKLKKWLITLTVSFDCLCVALGSSLYGEALPDLMIEMGISQRLGTAGVTFYLIGLAMGSVVAAPMSEILGRRLIYLVSMPVGMLFTMGVGLATNIRTVLVLRLFSGLFSSPPMSLAGGTVSDLWSNDPAQLAVAMAVFCLAPFLGPTIGPIVGGFAVNEKSWEWTQWVHLMFCGAVYPLLFLVPETLDSTILRRRMIKRGVELDEPDLDFEFVKMVVTVFLVRPFEMLMVEPIICFTSVYVAFLFAVLFGFFRAYPIIFGDLYGMERGISGLPFIGVAVGLVIGVFGFIWFDRIFFHPKNEDGTRGRRDENGDPLIFAPEARLTIAAIGSLLMPIALFWLAWTSRESIHWIVPTLAGVPFGFGLLWVFFGIVLYFSSTFPPQCLASALAANSVLRYTTASVFPLFINDMYEELGIDWATSIFAFITLAMLPVVLALYKFGDRLRQYSRYSFEAEDRKEQAEFDAKESFEDDSDQMSSPSGKYYGEAGSSFNRSSKTAMEQDVSNKV
ncbi:hypothetical protein FT663_03902 [Candidozyma haemuli var. vulneris]|uniref:Major facilitator superfamily (MFS) profile domain-containing protein n=1 Tax=Candidozyma haemuli TaxID=45357 RepID=A0A2V1AQ10_9ASCO|nr:hypothetical protein CXQ85_001641 [[Candida] haemuloni]KAF3987499.1 hypothetical protein FT662_03975 [[Candida] haemuloni var. vulneris]KAF3988797.1 hypothetical protein FT663_03902 [[Candida] haemuloni var. vulneris]PVH19333.1 hypothetical protein CXQ85_001641 [[Candida] haemuloni]